MEYAYIPAFCLLSKKRVSCTSIKQAVSRKPVYRLFFSPPTISPFDTIIQLSWTSPDYHKLS